MVIQLMVMAVLMPIMTILAFIVGYNVNATKKICVPKKHKKEQPTEDEEMLERINNARI